MGTIFYGVAGEGRGHAARARALVEALRREHRTVLFASGDSHALLVEVFRGTEVEVHRIPCLRFRYHRNHRLSYLKTGREAMRYLWGMPRLVDFLSYLIDQRQPDLILSDFEPALPRAARRCGVPVLCVDHQHFLTVSDLSELPLGLRCWAKMVSPVIHWFCPSAREMVVSSFFFPPLRSGYEHVTRVGVMLRPEILSAKPQVGDYLLTYLRRDVPESVLGALRSAPMPVKVYGLGEKPSQGRVTFHAIHERKFVEDLIHCHAVVTTAGNQLVGEALSLSKPVMALPEPGNYEQSINAHFLAKSGHGLCFDMNKLGPNDLGAFLERNEDLRAGITPERFHGNAKTLQVIRRHLKAPVPVANRKPTAVMGAS